MAQAARAVLQAGMLSRDGGTRDEEPVDRTASKHRRSAARLGERSPGSAGTDSAGEEGGREG